VKHKSLHLHTHTHTHLSERHKPIHIMIIKRNVGYLMFAVLLLLMTSTANAVGLDKSEQERTRTKLTPLAYANQFANTMHYLSEMPSAFCAHMKNGVGHANKILSFLVTPSETPDDVSSCSVMRDIRLKIGGIVKEAEDVKKAECPFDTANPGAGDPFVLEMKEICNLVTPITVGNGRSSTSQLHRDLNQGICAEDESMKKIIADIQYGMCWRVYDNVANQRDFGCDFFDEAQKYVTNAIEALKKIQENNEKAWFGNYCDFVLWHTFESRTISLKKSNDRSPAIVERVGLSAYEAGIRVNDRIVAIIEPETPSTLPFGLLGPTPSEEVPIPDLEHLHDYINDQKRNSLVGADEWSRAQQRDNWRRWQVRVVLQRFSVPNENMSKKARKRLRSRESANRITSEPLPLSVFEEPQIINRFDEEEDSLELRSAWEEEDE